MSGLHANGPGRATPCGVVPASTGWKSPEGLANQGCGNERGRWCGGEPPRHRLPSELATRSPTARDASREGLEVTLSPFEQVGNEAPGCRAAPALPRGKRRPGRLHETAGRKRRSVGRDGDADWSSRKTSISCDSEPQPSSERGAFQAWATAVARRAIHPGRSTRRSR